MKTIDIINGIALSIKNCFGQDYSIYCNSIEQGVKKPAFFIEKVSSSIENALGKRFLLKNNFKITLTVDNNFEYDRYDTEILLFEALDIISIGQEHLRASNLSSQILKNGIVIFADYNFFCYKQDEDYQLMENLQILKG